MAIEIKELHMSLHLGQPNQDNNLTNQVTKNESVLSSGCDDNMDRVGIVQDTVKEVLRIIKENQER